MATLLQSESRRLYSWWWDSHISPKNSKWLQENLKDMDAKVKTMIKLIEEDADSFARRAEMYYRKRPELMKLVEEFYRAYRALAERYDHATVELRQAQQTMAEAFPDQVPYLMPGDSPSVSAGPQDEHLALNVPHHIRALLEPDLLKDGRPLSPTNLFVTRNSEKGLKLLNEMFGSEGRIKKGLHIHEAESGKGDDEVQTLKKIIAKLQAEKEAVLLKYQESLEKLSSLEKEMKDAEGLDERASRAAIEIKILQETLAKLEAEKDVGLCQYQKCLERISSLENMIAQKQEDARGLSELTTQAETEIQNLKEELSRLEVEKEAALLQCSECLKAISSLKNEISLMEKNDRILNEQADRAENEIQALKEALVKLNKEKEDAELRYEQCLQKLADMECEMYLSQEDIDRLNTEVLNGIAKLKAMEEQCFQLGSSNKSLQLEAKNMAEKIAVKDRELLEKECALGKLQSLLQEEQSQFAEVESTLQALQKLHAQSQEERQTLAAELKNKLDMLNDLETCKKNLHGDLQRVMEENESLNTLNNSSSTSIMDLHDEISSLKEMKEKVEEIVSIQLSQNESLQQEIFHLEEEIGGLSRRYQALTEQVHAVGLDPKFIDSAVRELQHENVKLKEACKRNSEEKEVLHKKLTDMDKIWHENVGLEKSLLELSVKLEASQEKLKKLQDSSQSLQGEKSSLVDEKASLLSQLQLMTENMQKLSEKNALLENSLLGANVEIEALKAKLKSLEQLCQTLENEKSNLANERSTLVSHLESMERRVKDLELTCAMVDKKCSNLEKEKDFSARLVKNMHSYFSVEKQEHAVNMKSNESRLTVLENWVHVLQEERRFGKREFEEEVDKAANARVEIFILQKFIEDLEGKYLCLLLECQKHIEASKLADKLIADLESENLMQHTEVEFLSDEIEKLRMRFRQVSKSLQIDPSELHEDGTEEKMPVRQVLDRIMALRNSVVRSNEETQQLTVENMVLLTLLGESKLGSAEIESGKKLLEHEVNILMEQSDVLQKDRLELANERTQLRMELSKGMQQEEELKAIINSQYVSLSDLQGAYHALLEENFKVVGENRSLLQKLGSIEGKIDMLEEENGSILQEAIALGSQSSLFKSISEEKTEELRSLSLGVSGLHVTNDELRKKANMLGEALELKEAEIQRLDQITRNLQQEIDEEKGLTDQLHYQILIGKDNLRQKINETLDAEEKIMAVENLNADFQTTIEKLERECENSKRMKIKLEKRILELSNNAMNQQNEIECLREANDNLETEVVMLSKEIEERRTKEENLSSEMQERSNEFELWEAEASSFYFDMQISSIHEVLLENKVHELSAAYQRFNDENSMKDLAVEQMKERSALLESEVGELKAQLCGYVPAIASLRETVESFEQNPLLRTNLSTATSKQGQEGDMSQGVARCCQKIMPKEYPKGMDGVSDLHELQTRIQSVEKTVTNEIERLAADKANMEGRNDLRLQGKTDMTVKIAGSVNGPELLYLRGRSDEEHDPEIKGMKLGNVPSRNARQLKHISDVFEARKGISMKDIPLDRVSNYLSYSRSKKEHSGSDDHMLELWESTEQDYSFDPMGSDSRRNSALVNGNSSSSHQLKNAKQKGRSPSPELQIEKEVGIDKLEVLANINREPNCEGNRSIVLERLAADGQRLMSLQNIVVDLKKKIEEKRRSRKARSFEFERAKGQLKEVEEAIVQLVHTNYQLTKEIKEAPSALGRIAAVRSEEDVNLQIRTAAEQAQKECEKVGRLQFELESIHFILLKLEDEKKSKSKLKFSSSRASIFFRHFIYSGHRSNRRRKKPCFCGCARPSIKED